MRKRYKKIAAIILALMTAFTLVPSSAFAVADQETTTTEAVITEEDTVETETVEEEKTVETEASEEEAVEEEADEEETSQETKTVYEYSDDDISVTVTLSDAGDLPDEAQLAVEEITGDEAEEYINALSSDSTGYSLEVEGETTTLVYDISMTIDGVEVEPENTVTVEIAPSEELLEEIGSMETAVVTHFTDDDDLAKNEVVDVTTSETAVVFETDSFSYYTLTLASTNITTSLYNTASGNNQTVNKKYVNGSTALCLDHSKSASSTGGGCGNLVYVSTLSSYTSKADEIVKLLQYAKDGVFYDSEGNVYDVTSQGDAYSNSDFVFAVAQVAAWMVMDGSANTAQAAVSEAIKNVMEEMLPSLYQYFYSSNNYVANSIQSIVSYNAYVVYSYSSVTAYVYTQEGGGYQPFVTFYEPTPEGYIKIVKTSAVDEDCVTDNSAYSLAGAVYGVYSSKSAAESKSSNYVTTLTTNSSGTATSGALDPGTYYVTELTASTGYLVDDEVYTVKVTDGNTTLVNSGTVEEDVESDPLNIKLYKVNEDGEGAIEGAVFKVTYTWSGGSAVNYYITDENGCIDCLDTSYLCTSSGTKKSSANNFPTDDDGNICVYAGTVTVEEYSVPAGYIATDDTLTRTITVSSDGTISHTDSGSTEFTASGYVYNTTIRGGIELGKVDADLLSYTAQGNGSLSGAVIEIVNDSDEAVYMTEDDIEDSDYIEFVEDENNDGFYEPGETMLYLTSYENSSGEIVFSTDGNSDGICYTLPYGDYIAEEVSASLGYTLNTSWSVAFSISGNGEIVDKTDQSDLLKETIIKGGVEFSKMDAESLSYAALGAAALEGAQIKIVNASENAIYMAEDDVEDSDYIEYVEDEDGDHFYESGETVLILTTYADDDGNIIATTDADFDEECYTIPHGTYYAVEYSAGEGYNVNSDWKVYFSVTENGVVYGLDDLTDSSGNALDEDDAMLYDNVIRTNFTLSKKDESQSGMEGVLFQITSKTTGETHFFVTDSNGSFNFSFTEDEEEYANLNDDAISYTKVSGYYETLDADGNTIWVNESALSSSYIIWFGEYGTDSDGILQDAIEVVGTAI